MKSQEGIGSTFEFSFRLEDDELDASITSVINESESKLLDPEISDGTI